MGANKTLKQDIRDKTRAKRGRRRERKYNRADWGSVDPRIIKGFVELGQALDGAIRFGRSRDGAMFSIGFYIGDERFTEWVKPDDESDYEFARLIDEITEDFEIPSSLSDEAT